MLACTAATQLSINGSSVASTGRTVVCLTALDVVASRPCPPDIGRTCSLSEVRDTPTNINKRRLDALI